MNKEVEINELSPWQSFVLCLIQIQSKTSKHKLSFIFNTKTTSKLKKLNTSFIEKVNQIFCYSPT